MKTKLLRKLRKKCFILRGVIYDKKTYKQLNDFHQSVGEICWYLELIDSVYWDKHNDKKYYTRNKKQYLKSLNH